MRPRLTARSTLDPMTPDALEVALRARVATLLSRDDAAGRVALPARAPRRDRERCCGRSKRAARSEGYPGDAIDEGWGLRRGSQRPVAPARRPDHRTRA